MSIVVMVNEKFRESVPPWEVRNSPITLINVLTQCKEYYYMGFSSCAVYDKQGLIYYALLFEQCFKGCPQEFPGLFRRILDISLADEKVSVKWFICTTVIVPPHN